jgi:Protein of unknown function (DUF1236)
LPGTELSLRAFSPSSTEKENVMRKELIAGVVAAAALWPAMSLAQSPAEEGYHEGYRAGGPVGGIIGGTVGAAVELPGDVLGFVTGHPRRYERVDEEIVVGRPLPRTVHVYEIPRHREYVYAYVNERRVLVDPRTRRIVRIVE